MNIFGIDLKIDNNNYSSFSGWFISKHNINQKQIDSLTNFLNDNNQNLNIKSFDSEGEDLEDYCDDFEYIDLEKIGDGAIICIDLNYLEVYDSTVELSDVFLVNNEKEVIIIDQTGVILSV